MLHVDMEEACKQIHPGYKHLDVETMDDAENNTEFDLKTPDQKFHQAQTILGSLKETVSFPDCPLWLIPPPAQVTLSYKTWSQRGQQEKDKKSGYMRRTEDKKVCLASQHQS